MIELKKFGTTLTSRQSGKEALTAHAPVLKTANEDEVVVVNFDGVNTFSPSWGDEFLTPLYHRFGSRFFLNPSKNLSVQATIDILEESNQIKFQIR